MLKRLPAVLFVMCLLGSFAVVHGREAAKIKRVGAITADGLTFSVWVERPAIKTGDPIIVNYKVDNRSGRAIYLVRDNAAGAVFESYESIIFPEPFVPLGGHEPCDYDFIRVERNKSHQSRYRIAGDKYPKDARYAEQVWNLRVGFGYILDVRGLRVKESGDPTPCKALLNSRLKTLSLANLIVNISTP